MTSAERRLLIGIFAVLLTMLGFWGWMQHKESQVTEATAQGAAIHDTATAGQAKGEVYDQTVKASEPAVQAAKAKYERDNLKYRLIRDSERPIAAVPDAPVVPGDSPDGRDAGGDPVSGSPDPELLAARELISSQEAYIKALEGKVATQDLSIASWRGTAQARAQELVQANAVIAAQQGLIAGALLKGRLQGLAVGLGSGYVAGGLR